MHERYEPGQQWRTRPRSERRRGNGQQQPYFDEGFRGYEEEERDDDERRFRGESERESEDSFRRRDWRDWNERRDFDRPNPRFEQGGSAWRDRFGGRDWEQPRFAGNEPGQRSHGSWEQQEAYGQRPGQLGQGTYGGFGQDRSHGRRQESYGPHVGKGPKGYQRSDDRILEDANHALERHPSIDATEIEVVCQSGELILRGTVETRDEKRLAEQAVEDLAGVKDVRNELRVQSKSQQQQPPSTFGTSGRF
jgi:hypothetical protein